MPLHPRIQELLPPIIFKILGASPVTYTGNFADWKSALASCSGYDAPEIAQKVCTAALKVKNGEAVYERDGVIFNEIQYSWPLLAGLLRAASMNNNRFTVLDFGGALGSTYFQNKLFLDHLAHLKWIIVEQPSFVEQGKKHFEDKILGFDADLDHAVNSAPIDVVIMSSSLPYIENPRELLTKILTYNIKHIIIDRTPLLLNGNKDRLTVEKVPETIYRASYPAWILSRESILPLLKTKYKIIHEFTALAGEIALQSPSVQATDKGFILELK